MSTKSIQVRKAFPVQVGVHTDGEGFRDILAAHGMVVKDKARELLGEVDFTPQRQDVLLAPISVEELGLPDQSMYGKIRERAIGTEAVWNGHVYVVRSALAEDGPVLREAYPRQPKNEWLRIGMEGVEHPMGNLMIFRVVHGKDGVLYLDTDDGGDLDDPFDDHVRFVWRLEMKKPKKK